MGNDRNMTVDACVFVNKVQKDMENHHGCITIVKVGRKNMVARGAVKKKKV